MDRRGYPKLKEVNFNKQDSRTALQVLSDQRLIETLKRNDVFESVDEAGDVFDHNNFNGLPTVRYLMFSSRFSLIFLRSSGQWISGYPYGRRSRSGRRRRRGCHGARRNPQPVAGEPRRRVAKWNLRTVWGATVPHRADREQAAAAAAAECQVSTFYSCSTCLSHTLKVIFPNQCQKYAQRYRDT